MASKYACDHECLWHILGSTNNFFKFFLFPSAAITSAEFLSVTDSSDKGSDEFNAELLRLDLSCEGELIMLLLYGDLFTPHW